MPKQPGDPPGSISARGTRFLAQQPRNAEGKRPSETFDTRAEAVEFLRVAAAQAVLYGGRIDKAGTVPLGEALMTWLDGRRTIKGSTKEGYRPLARLLLRDEDGNIIGQHPYCAIAVRDIRAMHVEALLYDTTNENNGRVKLAELLGKFFKWATANDLTVRDPWIRSEAGDKIKENAKLAAVKNATTGRAWTVDEARALLAGITKAPAFRSAVAFMLVTGARRGETLGLAWGKVAPDFADLERNRTMGGGKIITEKTTKTRQPRPARYGPRMAAMLDDLRPAGPVKLDAYVFTTRGQPFSPGAVTQRIPYLAARLGIRDCGGTHALRRTFATALTTDGCPPVVREALLGHIEAYSVAQEGDMRKWAERADELFLGS